MHWLTLIWSMPAAACLTLGIIHLIVWIKDRRSFAHLFL